jgi:hypothetical protein
MKIRQPLFFLLNRSDTKNESGHCQEYVNDVTFFLKCVIYF